MNVTDYLLSLLSVSGHRGRPRASVKDKWAGKTDSLSEATDTEGRKEERRRKVFDFTEVKNGEGAETLESDEGGGSSRAISIAVTVTGL